MFFRRTQTKRCLPYTGTVRQCGVETNRKRGLPESVVSIRPSLCFGLLDHRLFRKYQSGDYSLFVLIYASRVSLWHFVRIVREALLR
jgi:hypothetical protein